MRIVFIDMHCINFLTNTFSQIKSGLKVKTYKHKYIVDYALENGIQVINYVTGNSTTNRSRKLKNCVKECRIVLDKSYGKESGIVIITNPNQIYADDIVIAYIYDDNQREVMRRIPVGHKVMMGNHFIALNEAYDFKEANIEAFVNEIDLSDNSFVKKYLNSNDVRNITCPYIFTERFFNMNYDRKNKAMGIGTLSTCKGNSGYGLYREEFDTEWIQPMRKELYDHANEYPDQLDSYISYIYEDRKEISPNDSLIKKVYKVIYNRRRGWTQSKYTSFDMVKKFNEYMMFVCPEELVGMPGIGFVEGMACGTAYIGLDTMYYRKLGLLPGKNYITYDGTLYGLIEVIKYYQAHTDETKMIAKNGMEFVRRNFNAQVVAENLFIELKKLTENRRS